MLQSWISSTILTLLFNLTTLHTTNFEGRDHVEADRVSSDLMASCGRNRDHQSVPTQSSNLSLETGGKQIPSSAKKSFSISKEKNTSEGRLEYANLGTRMNDTGDVPFVLLELQSIASPSRTQKLRGESTFDNATHQWPVPTPWLLKLAGINTNETCFVASDGVFQTSSNITALPNKSVGGNQPSSTWHKHWTDEEDEILRYAIAEKKIQKWKLIAKKYFKNTRSAEQCKHRWNNVRYSFAKEYMKHSLNRFLFSYSNFCVLSFLNS
jgi:hypothetical protein